MSSRNGQALSLPKYMEGLRADYDAARESRFRRRRTGIAPMGSGADYHVRDESRYLKVMEYARDMYRNDCVVGQIVDRATVNTIQDGITPDPQTGDDMVDANLKARWVEWTEDPEQCDVAGEMTFCDMEHVVNTQTTVDGDIVALAVQDGGVGKLQLIEAHRIRTPQGIKKDVALGVKLSSTRRRIEYYVTEDDLDPMSAAPKLGSMRTIPVRDADGHRQLFHIYHPKRASQTRGVTAFAPIFDLVGMHDDIEFATLVQRQIVSCFAIFRERQLEFSSGAPAKQGSQTTETLTDGTTRIIEGIGPGMQISGAPGEKLSGFAPNIPNQEFFPHVRLILTLIGINLGEPLVMVLMDASETNFSGWRGAIEQARMGFRSNQKMRVGRFNCPVWKWKVREWMGSDPALRAFALRTSPSNIDLDRSPIFWHRWNPPNWTYIEPKTDAEADALRLEKRLTSYRRLQAERGRDGEEVQDEIIADNGRLVAGAIAKAKELNAGNPEAQVDWRELVNYSPAGRAAAPVATPGETASVGTEGATAIEQVRLEADAYGVAVRAGVVTPQPADEETFRGKMELPPMSEEVRSAWSKDEGTRRPITITPVAGEKPASAFGAPPPAEDAPPEEEPTEPPEASVKPKRSRRKKADA